MGIELTLRELLECKDTSALFDVLFVEKCYKIISDVDLYGVGDKGMGLHDIVDHFLWLKRRSLNLEDKTQMINIFRDMVKLDGFLDKKVIAPSLKFDKGTNVTEDSWNIYRDIYSKLLKKMHLENRTIAIIYN